MQAEQECYIYGYQTIRIGIKILLKKKHIISKHRTIHDLSGPMTDYLLHTGPPDKDPSAPFKPQRWKQTPFYPALNLSLRISSLFCIFFYMSLLTQATFYRISGYNIYFARVMPVNALCSTKFYKDTHTIWGPSGIRSDLRVSVHFGYFVISGNKIASARYEACTQNTHTKHT